MAKLLIVAVTLTLVIVGLCNNSTKNEICEFVWRNATNNNSVCVRMNITAEFKVGYTSTVNNKTKSAVVNIPLACDNATNINGYCDLPLHNGYRRTLMNLTWGDNDEYVLTYTFSANFKKGYKQWNISEVALSVNVGEVFDDSTTDVVTGTQDQEKYLIQTTDLKHSYYCKSENKFNFNLNKNDSDFVNMSAKISHFKVQAFEFGNKTEGNYGSYVRCNEDINGSNTIPIAVGAGLAVLVIIVLCIYIIGRLRNYYKKKSYETLS